MIEYYDTIDNNEQKKFEERAKHILTDSREKKDARWEKLSA